MANNELNMLFINVFLAQISTGQHTWKKLKSLLPDEQKDL